MALGRAGAPVELSLDGGGSAGKAAAYHAVPASGRGRGVLVLDEGAALSDLARDACDRLARAGFAALAPDLAGAAGPGPALDAALRRLLGDAATDGARLGVVGFGAGGARAFEAAGRSRRVGCIVSFYGAPESHAPPVDTPALVVFGEDDERLRDGELPGLEARAPAARLQVEPGAGDGFMNETRADRYAAAPAASAWDAALAFLGASL